MPQSMQKPPPAPKATAVPGWGGAPRPTTAACSPPGPGEPGTRSCWGFPPPRHPLSLPMKREDDPRGQREQGDCGTHCLRFPSQARPRGGRHQVVSTWDRAAKEGCWRPQRSSCPSWQAPASPALCRGWARSPTAAQRHGTNGAQPISQVGPRGSSKPRV